MMQWQCNKNSYNLLASKYNRTMFFCGCVTMPDEKQHKK